MNIKRVDLRKSRFGLSRFQKTTRFPGAYFSVMKLGKPLLMFLLGVLFCVSAVHLTYFIIESQPTATRPDYWQTTDLDKESLRAYISQESCYKESIAFFGCLTALESLGSLLKGTEVSLHYQRDRQEDSVTIEFVPQEVPHFTHIKELLRFTQKRQEQKQRDWYNLYQRTMQEPIPFVLVLEAIIDGLSDQHSSQELIAEALNSYFGIVHSPHDGLVPHFELFSDIEAEEEDYFGVGVNLTVISHHLVVVRVVPNSPAAQSGLQAGDIVTHIQGEAVADMESAKALTSISDSNAIEVHLRWTREGDFYEATIKKEMQNAANVQTRIIKDENRTWGVIEVSSFENIEVCEKTRQAVIKLEKQAVQGLVLDLRDNPGGLLEQALCMVDIFLPKEQLVLRVQPLEQDFDLEDIFANTALPEVHFTKKAQETKLPLVVLINSRSASASEIVAGALKEAKRAHIIGERSYGKGTILHAKEFETDEYIHPTVVHFFTTATFHFASGKTNHLLGIQPDLTHVGLATPVPLPREEDLFYYRIRSQKVKPPVLSPLDISVQVAVNSTTCVQKLQKEGVVEKQVVGLGQDRDAYTHTAIGLLGCLRASTMPE